METNNLTAPIAVEKDRNTLTIELMNSCTAWPPPSLKA